MIETTELFTRANPLSRSQVLHNTKIKIKDDTTFQVIGKFPNGQSCLN